MKRGEIYWANLRPRSGSEQSGRRPVLIISNDGLNCIENWRSVIVVPLSSSLMQVFRSPSIVLLLSGTAGLLKDSLVICHQVTTIDKGKISEKIGTLSKEKMKLVHDSLKKTLEVY